MKEYQFLFNKTKFPFIWLSQVLSQLTVNMMTFLVIVNIFERTGSTVATSFVWIAYALPAIIVGPFAAASVDLFDKRKMLMLTNILQSLVVLSFAFFYRRYQYLSYGIVLVYSFLNQFYVPSETASIPSLIPKKFLARANGLFFITEQASVVIGFAAASLINELVGLDFAFILGSLFLFFAFVSVTFLPSLKTRLAFEELEKKVAEFFGRIIEGYQFIRYHREILIPFLFLVGIQISLAIALVNMPSLAEGVLRSRPATAGVLMVVPIGIGALISTGLVPQLLEKGIRKRRIIESALIGIAFSLLVISLLVPSINIWAGRFLAVIFFGLSGASFVAIVIPSFTFLQEKTPQKLMGRVFGNFWFITTSATVLPVIFSATITDILGVRLMFSFLALFALFLLFASHFYGDNLLNNQ